MLNEIDTTFKSVSADKIRYLYDIDKDKKIDAVYKCGFNFSELDVIREETNLSFLYMFTGRTYEEVFADNDNELEILRNSLAEKEREIESLKAILNQYKENS